MYLTEQLYPLYAFLPLLAATAFCDLRYMKIPNMLSLVGLGIFVMSAATYLPFEIAMERAISGAVSFAICFVLFMVRAFGGGDAKILPVLFLFIPIPMLPIYLLGFSAAMIVGMVGIFLVRQLVNREAATWVSLKPGAGFPMGISIALSGFLLPVSLALFTSVSPI